LVTYDFALTIDVRSLMSATPVSKYKSTNFLPSYLQLGIPLNKKRNGMTKFDYLKCKLKKKKGQMKISIARSHWSIISTYWNFAENAPSETTLASILPLNVPRTSVSVIEVTVIVKSVSLVNNVDASVA